MNSEDLWIAYGASIAGGWLVSGVCVYVMRRSIGHKRPFFRWIDTWVGGTERAIATTLFLWSPHLLPGFIGGWITAKFAANWKRQAVEGVGQISLVFLVGSAISFACSIAGGLIACPNCLSAFAN